MRVDPSSGIFASVNARSGSAAAGHLIVGKANKASVVHCLRHGQSASAATAGSAIVRPATAVAASETGSARPAQIFVNCILGHNVIKPLLILKKKFNRGPSYFPNRCAETEINALLSVLRNWVYTLMSHYRNV